MSAPAIKICGLTRAVDAQQAAELGAWALGFIFFAGSRRVVSPLAAAQIIAGVRASGLRPLMVGVFVNPSLGEVLAAVETAKLDLVQLHGDESPLFCREVSTQISQVRIIKALRATTLEDLAPLTTYGELEALLLETPVPGTWGGTGVAGDWKLARAAKQHLPTTRLILAGGLNPANIADALRIARPDAVDVSSGLEASPGVKSPQLMKEFFDNVARNTK
jgi:phosphoribosylanthranilate isomerase